MIELRTLGSVELRAAEGGDSSPKLQPKRLAVLSYLAAARPRGLHTRDTLLALFWPELDGEHARAALRKTLYHLREELGRKAVVSRGSKVGVDPEHLHCDAVAFRAALEAGDREQALGLYRGEFLAGFHVTGAPGFEHWLDTERARLKRQALAAARALSEKVGEAGEAVNAVRWARRAAEIDPLDEGALCHLLGTLDRLGNRTAAVRAYETFRLRMKERLDIDPAPETRELIETIRGREQPAAARGKASASAPSRAPDKADRQSEPPERSSAVRTVRKSGPDGGHSVDAGAPRQHPAGGTAAGKTEAGSRWRRPVGALVLVATATVGVSLLVGSEQATTAGSGSATQFTERSVAVLPFEPLGSETERYFVQGVREAVLSSLASVEDIVVVSPGTLDGPGKRPDATDRVGENLGVAHVMVGSVQRAGHRLRVTTRLLRADSERQVWAEQFDREYGAEALFDVQSRIAREVARALDVRLTPEESRRLARGLPDDVTAYDYYLRGKGKLRYVPGPPIADREVVEQAIGLFRRALELDTDFAPAHAGLAEAYGKMSSVTGERFWMDSMQAAANRTLELDPEIPEGHLALAEYHRKHHGSHHDRKFLRSARRALDLRPNDPQATVKLAQWWFGGRPGPPQLDQALCWVERAARLDPTNPDLRRGLAQVHGWMGNLRAAEAEASRALKQAPDDLRIYRRLAEIALARGDRPLATEYYRTARRLASSSIPDLLELGGMATSLGLLDSARVHLAASSDRFSTTWTGEQLQFAYALWETGYRERAREILDRRERRERRALETGKANYWPEFNLAQVLATRGETEAAVDVLEEAVDQGWRQLFRIRPELDGPMHGLWGHDRFDALMATVRTKVDSMAARVQREGCEAIRELPSAMTSAG